MKEKFMGKFIFAFTIILVMFASCRQPTQEAQLTDFENLTYNPSVEELYNSGIPVLHIQTSDNSGITDKTEWKTASFNLYENSAMQPSQSISEVQIKGRGNSSWSLPKKPYALKFTDKKSMINLPESKRWVLTANYSDKTLLRNYFISRLGNEIYTAVWNPSFQSIHLVLNGSYRGVYLLGENIKIDDGRVNIKDISKKNNGGFIFEINARLDEKFNFTTTKKVPISLKDPDEVSEEIQNKVKEIIQTAEDVLFDTEYLAETNGYKKYFDIDSVIDWYLMNELGKNVDAASFSSIYFYYDGNDKLLHMGPNWDFDISCGNVNYSDCDTYDGLYIKENSVWIKRMFTDESFEAKVKERWTETKIQLKTKIENDLAEYANKLKKAAKHNFSKWQILGHYVWPNASGFENRKTYEREVGYLRNWLSNRYNFLDKAFATAK